MKKILIKIGIGTLYQTLGKITTAFLGFLSILFLTRYLGTAGYGNYTLVFAYLSFFSTFADLGLQTQIIKEATHITNHYLFGTFLWLKILLTIFSSGIAIIALLFFNYPSAVNQGIILGAIAVSIGSFTGYANTIFQANSRLDLLTITDVLTKIVTIICIIICTLLHYNWYYLIAGVAVGNLAGLVFALYSSSRIIPISFVFHFKSARSLILKSLFLGLASVLSSLYFRLDTIMLSVLRGASEVGIYSLAYKVFENMLVFWWFYLASFYPLLSNIHGKKDYKQFRELIYNSIVVSLVYSAIMIFAGNIGAKLLITIFGGKAFMQSALPLQILVLSCLFFFFTSLFYYYFFLKDKVTVILLCIFVSLLFNFVLNLIFIPVYGYIAASWITVATEIFLTILYSFVWFFLWGKYKIKRTYSLV